MASGRIDETPSSMRPCTIQPCACFKIPRELLSLVASQLDRPSLLSLARASRCFNLIANEHFWNSLQLGLINPKGKLHAAPMPPFAHDTLISEAEAVEFEQKCKMAQREKMETIIRRGNEGHRWNKVREIKMEGLRAGTEGLVAVLAATSPSLERLDLSVSRLLPTDRPPHALYILHAAPHISDPLSFPNLLHLRLGEHARGDVNFCLRICGVSPRLNSLEISCHCRSDATIDRCADAMEWSQLGPMTTVRRLGLAWSGGYPEHGKARSTVFLKILRLCTQVEQLSLHPRFSVDLRVHSSDPSRLQILPTIAKLPLRELVWGITIRQFSILYSKLDPAIGDRTLPVRRLALLMDVWLDTYSQLPTMPELEWLCFDYTRGSRRDNYNRHSVLPDFSSPPATRAQSMLPEFADSLRRNNRLRYIHAVRGSVAEEGLGIFTEMDEAEQSGLISGHITSISHGSQELVCARLISQWVMRLDIDASVRPDSISSQRKLYMARNGTRRVRDFERAETSHWQVLADYDGFAVPLEVIEKMKGIEERNGTVDWERRQVEVGAEAWSVLLQWRDRAHAEMIEKGAEWSPVSV